MSGNPMNSNPAVVDGDHEPARRLRAAILASTKSNLYSSTNLLHDSIYSWSIDEQDITTKSLDTLLHAIKEVDHITYRTNTININTTAAMDKLMENMRGEDHATLAATLHAIRVHHIDVVNFLSAIKFDTLLTLEHNIKSAHSMANAKRDELRIHLNAVNDYSEVLSGPLFEKAFAESLIRRRAVVIYSLIKSSTSFFVYGVVLLFLSFLVLVRMQEMPRLLVIYFARLLIVICGGDD